MNLTDTERCAIEAMKAEAHAKATRPDGSVSPRAASKHFVTILRESEGISPTVIGAYLDSLATKGAAKVMADWRRTKRSNAKTAKGTKVDAPRFAGIRRPDSVGKSEHVQVELPGMTIEELRSHREKLERQRDTLSKEITLTSDLIAVMEAEGYTTAGQALDHLLRAA